VSMEGDDCGVPPVRRCTSYALASRRTADAVRSVPSDPTLISAMKGRSISGAGARALSSGCSITAASAFHLSENCSDSDSSLSTPRKKRF